jgi:hypothetical protein
MLSKMSGGNFNWFLHVMLFMHTLYIIQKQEDKGRDDSDDNEDDAEVDVEEEG